MPGQAGTLETIAQQIGLALAPLAVELTPANIIPFLAELGLRFPPQLLTAPFKNALSTAATAAGALPNTIAQLATDIQNDNAAAILEDGAKLIQEIEAVVTALEQIGTELGNLAHSLPGLNSAEVTSFAASLAENLLGYLLISYVEGIESGWIGLANLLGIVDYIPNAGGGDAAHPAFTTKKLQLSRLSTLMTSPADLVKTVYQWGSPTFDGSLLIPRLSASLNLFGLPAAMNSSGPPHSVATQLVTLEANPTTNPPGLLATLMETFPAGLNLTLPLPAPWSMNLQVQGNFTASLQATLTPPVGVALLPPSGVLNGTLQMSLAAQAPDASHPLILLGQTGGSYVGANSFTFGAGLTATWNSATGRAQAVPSIQFSIVKGTVFIDMSDADGFLSDVVSGTPIQATFDLKATWQPDTGLHITGGAQLQIDLPLHLDLGPVTLPILHLIAGVSSTGIPIEVSAGLGVALGPIQASVDRVGVIANLSFPANGGNLGPADLSIQFKPPNGLGLELDMGLAAGGGYITFDPSKGQYAGVLQVSLVNVIQVVVIGVLDTVMPDGSSGFSFLLIITFDFPPIQLGFGFTLNSVGGLGGINRTMSIDALQAGFRARTLASVLSPPNPIANAPQIISDIRNFFPVAEGRYLLGPLLTIGWGTPTLISLSLGVLLEVPDPVRIVILGLIDAGLPTEEDALLQLHIEVLGVIDFGAQTLSIDGSLYDSSLLVYALAGDLALRLAWGANPNFVFALGGLNPQFNADGLNLPVMKRMSVSIGNGDNPRISSNSYFAITSNTVQFGANVQAYASAGGFSIQGYLGFDVLIVVSPFSFEFDFSASFDVAFEGASLLGLTVHGTIAGPTPWHFHGEASISLLFFSVTASVDLTWGSNTQVTIPQQPVLGDLFTALANPANWTAALPSGTGPAVSLAKPAPGDTTLLVHPMGTLTVKETVVPLDLQIDRYGSAAPSDGTRFSIASVQINGAAESAQSIQDYFAPGQFLNLSDSDKLSSPSFELFDAGVTIGSAAVLTGQDRARVVSYDEIYIDDPSNQSRFSRVYQMPVLIQQALSYQSAGFASPAKNSGLQKYGAAAAVASIKISSTQYLVTTVDDLSVRSDIVSTAGSSYYQAQAALTSYLALHPEESPNLQVLAVHEVAA